MDVAMEGAARGLRLAAGAASSVACLLLGIASQAMAANQSYEFVQDRSYHNGFQVLDPAFPGAPLYDLAVLHARTTPSWSLAQWNSQGSIGRLGTVRPDGSYFFANQYKAIAFKPAEYLDLAINSENEWASTLADEPGLAVFPVFEHGQLIGDLPVSEKAWPELLISQVFFDVDCQGCTPPTPPVTRLTSLWLDFTAQLTYVALPLPDVAQLHDPIMFPMYISIQNMNKISPGYLEFIQINIPIFDSRFAMTAPNQGFDPYTSAYYSTGSAFWSTTSTQSGEPVRFRRNMLPFVIASLENAFAQGYLPKSATMDDFYVRAINVGWEMNGLDIATMRLSPIRLKAFWQAP